MHRPFPFFSILFASALALAAGAHEASAQAVSASPADTGIPPRVVKIKARTNPGDLEYRWVFENQKLLQGFLPPGERMIDLNWRITFTELNLPQQDAWVPRGWAVALVASGFEQTVPVARGGYFILPALPTGRLGSTIMFREQSLQGYIGAAWRLRVGAGQRLPYAGFARAMEELRSVQNGIPVRHEGLRQVRTGRYDALKACFLAAGGRVLVDGAPAADASVGNCEILKFDPARAAAGHTIEFAGPLDIVTVVESADYLAYLDLPETDGAQAASGADDGDSDGDGDGDGDGAAGAASTSLANLSYASTFKRQLRLQGGLSAPATLVDFVWRMSFEDLDEAAQDAWVPQGWALGLVDKGFAHAVPVARGGYFLLPALPPGRRDATLVFREKDRRKRVGAAWVVRTREGQRPYLYYGEVEEAMRAVRAAQDTIPDAHAELAALRVAHYDGLKACFLASGGVVFVGDTPVADATVGNCKVLKFDPARNVDEKIEFVGQLDAVTVVDTAPYLHPKG